MRREQNAGNGRNEDGTFATGNPGGPGRPSRATETAYMRVVMEACTLDEWQAIVAKCVEAAKAGDPKAREWLASYLVGRPSDQHRARKPSRVLAELDAETDPVQDERVSMERVRRWDELLGPK